MILESLKLRDFGVFKGVHEFDLAPRSSGGVNCPIVLFGGLNGAGKTTILTATRLALYGRQSLGISTSKKAYHQFLTDYLHDSKTTGIKSKNATINLTFSFANLGILNHYHVIRSWAAVGGTIKESLKIAQNGNIVSGLSYEQAQGFLNELIPIGVSDLFFFDGEKIALLAEDEQGDVLAIAVKKLIGLDVIEKLIADITVFIRNHNKKFFTDELKSKVRKLEMLLDLKEKDIEAEQVNYQSIKIQLVHAAKLVEQLTNNLSTQGGAWAATREHEIEKLSGYKAEKEALQAKIRGGVSGSYPLSIAPDFVNHCLDKLREEEGIKQNQSVAAVLSEHFNSLDEKLSTVLEDSVFEQVKAEINGEFAELLAVQERPSRMHDISVSAYANISSTARDALGQQKEDLTNTAEMILAINVKMDSAGINIARAPEQDLLTVHIQKLNDAQEAKSSLEVQASKQEEKLKALLLEAMDIVRALNKAHTNLIESAEKSKALEHAHKAKSALKEFAKRVAVNKIKNVEKEFIHTFKRLTRKGDLSISAEIDPENFAVKLLNDFGKEIPKKSLSAGERQVYAISILESLAKTSGRKLPIIIDTPLGRLDSKHRKNIVENYFPQASHQVIILSTDTEIDETYHKSLEEHISHTILLGYKGSEGSSSIQEGYFWKGKEAINHAAK